MIDYFGARHNEEYTYWSVNRATWQDERRLGSIRGSSAELAALTDYKLNVQLAFEGYEAPVQDSIGRAYYSFDDESGNHAEQCIGTFVVSYSDTSECGDYAGGVLRGVKVAGTADCAGVLVLADSDGPGVPYTVQTDVDVVYVAAQLLGICGLNVIVQSDSSFRLSSPHTFETDASWLRIANWLLSAAGFRAAHPDVRGNVILARADDGTNPVFKFEAGARSIMHPEIRIENEWQDTPNCVRAFYSDDVCSIWAAAYNDSGSRISIDARGIRSVRYEETDLAGETPEEKLDVLKERVLRKLIDNSHEIERVEVRHPHVPIQPWDVISVDNGTERTGTITNMSIDLGPAAQCVTKTRSFIYPEIVTRVEGGVDD